MQASDVALLGFVSAAQRYVDKHIEDGSNLGDLNKIDISKLKKELSEQLKFLALSDTYKKELIETGAKAFDEYAKDKLGNKKNILFELGEVFTPDVKKTPNQNVNMPKIKTAYNDSKDDYGVTNDDNILLAIASAASKSDEELNREFNQPQVKIAKPANMDEIYSSVMANEEIAKTNPSNSDINELISSVLDKREVGKVINKPKINAKVKLENNKPKEQKVQKVETKVQIDVDDENIPLSERLKSIGKNEQVQEVVETSDVQEDINVPTYQPIITNPGLDIQKTTEVFHKTEKPEDSQDRTINDLLDGLENLQKRQEERRKIKEPKSEIDADVYKNISEAYPYLDGEFIIDIYDQRFEIDRDYELDKEYIVLHRISFKDIESLRQFVEIMVNHEYSINVDENKRIVDAFKPLKNEHGAILTNIYTLANQAAIIEGKYEGYQVIDVE